MFAIFFIIVLTKLHYIRTADSEEASHEVKTVEGWLMVILFSLGVSYAIKISIYP